MNHSLQDPRLLQEVGDLTRMDVVSVGLKTLLLLVLRPSGNLDW